MALDFPTSPVNGQGYQGFEWDATAGVWRIVKQFVDPADIPQAIQFLCVAGGGSGGGYVGGGGGAGGFLSSVVGEESYANYDFVAYGPAGKLQTLPFSGSFTVTVGAGAARGAILGSTSRIGDYYSYGGGRGASGGGDGSYTATGGGSSGGGATHNPNRAPGTANPPGQGFYGGYSPIAGGLYQSAGGGGAAQRGGQPASNNDTENSYGGQGKVSTITGSSVYYAGGGGASCTGLASGGVPGLGGLGGGGDAVAFAETGAQAGATNTGGGGGGGRVDGTAPGAAGGSGIVVIRYPVTLPTLTTIGAGLTYSYGVGDNYRIYTFTAGTDTVTV